MAVVVEVVVMVRRAQVMVRSGKVRVVAAPLLFREVTGTVVPSEKVRVAPVMWSEVLGRS